MTSFNKINNYSETYKTYFFILAFFLISNISEAQTKEIIYSNQQWSQYYNQLNLPNKWVVLSDIGYQSKSSFKEKSQYLIRASIGKQFNANILFSVGFAHFGVYDSKKVSKLEFRPYQELVVKQQHHKVKIEQRVRIEERYFKTVAQENIPSEKSFNFRLRYRFMFYIPVMKLSASEPNKKLLFGIGDEIFLNAGKEIVYNIFSRNRILLGPVVQFNKNFSIGLTYNHQFDASNTPNQYKQFYVFLLGIKQKINWKK